MKTNKCWLQGYMWSDGGEERPLLAVQQLETERSQYIQTLPWPLPAEPQDTLREKDDMAACHQSTWMENVLNLTSSDYVKQERYRRIYCMCHETTKTVLLLTTVRCLNRRGANKLYPSRKKPGQNYVYDGLSHKHDTAETKVHIYSRILELRVFPFRISL